MKDGAQMPKAGHNRDEWTTPTLQDLASVEDVALNMSGAVNDGGFVADS